MLNPANLVFKIPKIGKIVDIENSSTILACHTGADDGDGLVRARGTIYESETSESETEK